MHDLWKTAEENMDDDISRNYINFITESDLFKILLKSMYLQGAPTSFRWEVLVKISNLREIRSLIFFSKKNRQIKVRSALFS